MMINCGTALFVAIAIASNGVQPSMATGVEPFNGRLYAAVSRWTPDEALTVRDAALVPPSLQARFVRFARCHAAFRSRLPNPKEFFGSSALPHQRALERALACVIEAPTIASMAAEYARHARILYEWEGLHTSPPEEAAYAEAFIHDQPTSPLVPYLYLFVAERARYAFELLDGDKDDGEMVALAVRYRTFVGRARAADPLVGLIANDLDGLSFVYRYVGKHPRDF